MHTRFFIPLTIVLSVLLMNFNMVSYTTPKQIKAVSVKEILFIPWGTSGLTQDSVPMLVDPKKMSFRLAKKDYPYRVMPSGHILLLKSERLDGKMHFAVFQYCPHDSLLRSVPVPSPSAENIEGHEIVDFASDSSGALYVLERYREKNGLRQVLMKLKPDGEISWKTESEYSIVNYDTNTLTGDFDKVIITGNDKVYVTMGRFGIFLGEIDKPSGKLNWLVKEAQRFSCNLFVGNGTTVWFTTPHPSKGLSWKSYNWDTRIFESETTFPNSGENVFFPFSGDRNGILYLEQSGNIRSLSKNGDTLWEYAIPKIYSTKSHHVYVLSIENDKKINIDHFGLDGQIISAFRIDQLKHTECELEKIEINDVDENGNITISAIDGKSLNTHYFTYDSNGMQIGNTKDEIADGGLEAQNGKVFKQIDEDGHLFVAYQGEKGFYVFQISFQ